MSNEQQISELTTQIGNLTTVVTLQNETATKLISKHDREIYGDVGEPGLKSKQESHNLQLTSVVESLALQDKKRFRRDLILYSLLLSTIISLGLIVLQN